MGPFAGSAGPWFPESLDQAKVAALADRVADWIRSGAVVGGRARLCLRVREPERTGEAWGVELLAQDLDEPSLVVPLVEMWGAGCSVSPFGPGATEELLKALARMARLAPELAPALDMAVADSVGLDDRAVVTVCATGSWH